MRPSLVLLAGPNGAGKSTLYQTRVAPSFAGPFINADIIQRDELKDPSMGASYEAARIAEARRIEMLETEAGASRPKPSSRTPRSSRLSTAPGRAAISSWSCMWAWIAPTSP